MMAIHYPMTTPMELYLCVSTMSMKSKERVQKINEAR